MDECVGRLISQDRYGVEHSIKNPLQVPNKDAKDDRIKNNNNNKMNEVVMR